MSTGNRGSVGPQTGSTEPVLPRFPAATRAQKVLIAGTLLCYLIGYPVALALDSSIGWVLVTIGGFFLVALGIVTVRRIHRSSGASQSMPSSD